MNKEKRLEKLFYNIMECDKCILKDELKSDLFYRSLFTESPWVYPTYKGVKGFFGRSKVMFIASKPSIGYFPSWRDKAFYSALRKEGFDYAHITDLIKCRGKVGSENLLDFERCYEHLQEEIKIIQPEVVVFVGERSGKLFKQAEKHLNKKLLKIINKYRIEFIPHYSQCKMNKDELEDWIRSNLQKIK